MGLLEFCKQFVFLKGKLLSFEGRDYLPDVYSSTDRNLVLRCSRQVEKSTQLANCRRRSARPPRDAQPLRASADDHYRHAKADRQPSGECVSEIHGV
jgi:ribosomal protein S21